MTGVMKKIGNRWFMFKKRIRNVCWLFLVCGANVWAEATEGGGNGGEGDGSGGNICEFYSNLARFLYTELI